MRRAAAPSHVLRLYVLRFQLHFFFAAGAAALPAGAAALPAGALPAGALPAGAAALPAGALPPGAAAAAPATAPSAASSFGAALAIAALRWPTFGSPNGFDPSCHLAASFSFSSRSPRVSTLRWRIRALALFKLRSRDIGQVLR